MCHRHALMACLSFLVLQTSSGSHADAARARTDSGAPPAASLSPSRKKIIAHRVAFESDTAALRPEAAPVLDEAVALVSHDDSVIVIVQQPKDDRYSDASRLLLARRRAEAVRQYLMEHGVAVRRTTLPPDAVGTIAAGQPLELHVE